MMAKVKLGKRLYVTPNETRLVEEGDPAAARLYCSEHATVDNEDALVKAYLDKHVKEAEDNAEEREAKAPAKKKAAKKKKSYKGKREDKQDKAKTEDKTKTYRFGGN